MHARFELYFSYSQFMVYDQSVRLPGCAWTDRHSAQGFARRESTVNFNTPIEFGHAHVSVSRDSYRPAERYDRVIAVPFLVTSGKVVVEGPEENTSETRVALSPGNYRLVGCPRSREDAHELGGLVEQSLELWQVGDGRGDRQVEPELRFVSSHTVEIFDTKSSGDFDRQAAR